jgi:prophage maintenance system killer protein
MYTFLAINDFRLTADSKEIYAFTAGLYEAKDFSFEKLHPWLKSHTVSI